MLSNQIKPYILPWPVANTMCRILVPKADGRPFSCTGGGGSLSAMFTVSQNRMISHVLIILLFPTGFNCTTSPLITPLEVSLICLKEDIPEGCRHCNWSQALAGVFARSGVIHLSSIHLFKGWVGSKRTTN